MQNTDYKKFSFLFSVNIETNNLLMCLVSGCVGFKGCGQDVKRYLYLRQHPRDFLPFIILTFFSSRELPFGILGAAPAPGRAGLSSGVTDTTPRAWLTASTGCRVQCPSSTTGAPGPQVPASLCCGTTGVRVRVSRIISQPPVTSARGAQCPASAAPSSLMIGSPLTRLCTSTSRRTRVARSRQCRGAPAPGRG